MNLSTEHPNEDQLRNYFQGLLGEDHSEAIDEHLENCVQCTDKIQGFPKDDPSLIGVIQSVLEQVTLDSNSGGPADHDTQTHSSHVDQPVTTWAGKYQLLEELGRGGMGVVYRALDTHLKREVALKVIIAGEHSSGVQRERFRREAEMIARLKHPGIVQIYELGEVGNQPFLALELVTGPNLSQVTRSREQPVQWAALVTLQLSQAIHYAHQQSIIHRDLKPGNVLVSVADESETQTDSELGSGEFHDPALVDVPVTKITDFGLAKQLDSNEQMTHTGQAMGTPAYMSPEQAAGKVKEIGPATDIYALGVLLYEFLTGRPPLEGPDAVSTMIAVMERDPVSLRNIRRDVPRDLETICMKCLMKHPDDRYASVRDLGRDLEFFLAGEPILARPPNPWRRLSHWARNRPQLAICYLASIVCFGLHLMSKHILKVPFHTGEFAGYAPFLFVGWAGLTTLFEVLARKFKRVGIGLYGFFGVTIVWMSVIFSFDEGPRTPPVPLYFALVSVSVLVLPKSSFIWFTTLLSVACYSALAFHANLISGRGIVGPDEATGFVAGLIMVGICMQLILRRAKRRFVRDDQWESRPSGTRSCAEKGESASPGTVDNRTRPGGGQVLGWRRR
ncbi:MAG: serine/threonine-protein kinase [Planctomycetota bacterium]